MMRVLGKAMATSSGATGVFNNIMMIADIGILKDIQYEALKVIARVVGTYAVPRSQEPPNIPPDNPKIRHTLINMRLSSDDHYVHEWFIHYNILEITSGVYTIKFTHDQFITLLDDFRIKCPAAYERFAATYEPQSRPTEYKKVIIEWLREYIVIHRAVHAEEFD
jgi:hypothetical protein